MTKKLRKSVRSPATILVVDPDDSRRKAARGLLEALGYRVLDASYAGGAEQIARVYVGPIHVLLVETEASDLNGQALTDRLRAIHPELRVLFSSVQPQEELIEQGQLGSNQPFLQKPFEKDELAQKVRRVLSASG